MIRPSFPVQIAAIGVLALSLRLVGTDWGKPYAYHFDEAFLLKPALRIVENGDPNPRFFRYPSLLIYLESLIVAANNSLRGMPLRQPQGPGYGPQDLYPETWPALFGGRHLVAAFGTLGVVATGYVARATGGPVAGVFAALALALFPLHVEHSHYLTTDVPAAAFTTVALAFLLNGAAPRALLAAGLAAGLGVSTKYTAAAVLPVLVLVALSDSTRCWRARIGRATLLCLLSGLAFAVTTPYALLDLQAFLADLGAVKAHYTGGHLGAEGAGNWAWYLRRLRQDGLGTIGMAVIGAGFCFTFWEAAGALRVPGTSGAACRARTRRPIVALLLLAGAGAWFCWLGSVPVRFERNLLPSVVLACAAAGHGWGACVYRLRARNAAVPRLVAALVAVAMLGPLGVSATLLAKLRAQDTRTLAARWIAEHLPPGSAIVREEYTPQPDTDRYRVRYVWSLAVDDAPEYERQGVEYLVASQRIYGRILNDARPQVQRMADRYRRMFAYPRAATFAPGGNVSGPVVEILRVQPAGGYRAN